LEGNGLLPDVVEEVHGQGLEASLGVPVRRGVVSVDGSEVALAVYERVAQGEVLHHAHEGVVDRRVTVRVVLAQDVSHHGRALLVRTVGHEPQLVHRIEDAAMHRLESVSHVRQGALDDDRHRVVEEGLPHLFFDEARDDPFPLPGRSHSFSRQGAAGDVSTR
jgi:hypothetical protein